jgi:tetratricopeptide (TPR) repeat protein
VIGVARLGAALKHQGSYDRAIESLQRAVALSDRLPDHLAQLGQTYALAGRVGDAERVLEELDAQSKTRYVPAFDRVLIYAGLGNREQAFDWLRRAYDERYSLLVLLQVDPDLERLRSDPRFEALVRRVSSTPAQ